MRIYTYHSNQTTPPAELDFASKRRADFARQAVRLEFRARDARALDYEGFVDRGPGEAPRPAPEAWQRKAQWAGFPINAESLVPGPPNSCVPEAFRRPRLSARPFHDLRTRRQNHEF